MSDVVNIIAAFTALNKIDEINMEVMFTMYLNALIELLDAARQIRDPPRPPPPTHHLQPGRPKRLVKPHDTCGIQVYISFFYIY